MVALLIALTAVSGGLAVRRRRRDRLPTRAVIISPRRSTAVAGDGAVRSVQSAEFAIRERDLEDLWTPQNLENLARTYWRFLSRVTLGLIRVIYSDDDRRVALLIPQLTLLRFEPPRYEIEPAHGSVCWRIRDGLLVTRAGRGSGFLKIDVHRQAPPSNGGGPDPEARSKVRMEIQVANFYPAIASRFSLPVYMGTQSWIHVLVTHGFLRSLSRLSLAETRIGALRDAVVGAVTARDAAGGGPQDQPRGRAGRTRERERRAVGAARDQP